MNILDRAPFGIVNGDLDVDAIFRLTRKDKDVDLKVELTLIPHLYFFLQTPWLLLIPKTHF